MTWLVMSWSGLVNPRAVECFLFPDLLKRQLFSVSINYINPIKYGQPNMFQYEFHSHNTHKNLQSVDGFKKKLDRNTNKLPISSAVFSIDRTEEPIY